jgi:hypothetical protein
MDGKSSRIAILEQLFGFGFGFGFGFDSHRYQQHVKRFVFAALLLVRGEGGLHVGDREWFRQKGRHAGLLCQRARDRVRVRRHAHDRQRRSQTTAALAIRSFEFDLVRRRRRRAGTARLVDVCLAMIMITIMSGTRVESVSRRRQ